MKRMIDYKPEITKTVSGILRMRTLEFGTGALGWARASDIDAETGVIDNASWNGKTLMIAQADAAAVNACQKLHPSWMTATPTSLTKYTTSGDDLTDFSTASDWVFVYDPSSQGQRSGGTMTIEGKFLTQSGNTLSLTDSISLGIYSEYTENTRLGQLIVDAGGKEFLTEDSESYYILPGQYVHFYDNDKNSFRIDFKAMFGNSIKLYNKTEEIHTDIRFLPTIDMRNNPMAYLD